MNTTKVNVKRRLYLPQFVFNLLVSMVLSVSVQAEDSAPTLEIRDAKTGVPAAQAVLLDMKVDGRVDGMLATVSVSQTFENTTDTWVHGTYVFPLPESAAVDNMTFVVNGRKIQGKIKEKQEAKQIFQKAKKAGKKAALFEQNRPNLFTMKVANIPPHSKVQADIRYVEVAKYDAGEFSLRLPTTLTPRYIPGALNTFSKSNSLNVAKVTADNPDRINHEKVKGTERRKVAAESRELDTTNLDLGKGTGWAINTAAVPDASEITPPQVRLSQQEKTNKNTHHYQVNFLLNTSLPLKRIEASQAIEITEKNGEHALTLKYGNAPMDEDFELTWAAKRQDMPLAAAFQQTFGGEHYNMVMLVPPTQLLKLAVPRRMIFVIDSSGSMAGGSMAQAKAGLKRALTYLGSEDSFNIIDFDDKTKKLFNQPVVADTASLAEATRFIDGLDADGGTEIGLALDTATDKSQNEAGKIEQVVFITDGSVGNEKEIFERIQHRLGDNRLFTIGIGSAPNSYFMQKAAQFGRGSYTYINSVDDVATKMDALFKKLQAPVVSNINVGWGSDNASINVDAYPKRSPDLYVGEPLVLLAKANEPLSHIVVSGDYAGKTWQRDMLLTTALESDNLDSLWGRRKIDAINDSYNLGLITEEKAKKSIVPVAIKHHLMSKFTSFVAVEELISKPEHLKAVNKNVLNLMPKNSSMHAPYPDTATNAQLLQLMGLMLLVLAGLFWRRERKSNNASLDL